jgi:hypothetical protein
MSDYADVLIDIHESRQPVEEPASRSTFEAVIQVQGSGQRRGIFQLDVDSLDISRPDEYGGLLGDSLATPALQAALVEARALSTVGARLRLQIDERVAPLQTLRWELLRLPSSALDAAACSDTTPFSRYVPLAEQDRTPPADPVFTVLVAFANPKGLPDDLNIPVEDEIAALLAEFNAKGLNQLARLHVQLMPGRTPISASLTNAIRAANWTLLDGSTGLRQIQTALGRGCHALHLVCHGRALRDRGELTLEDDTGAPVQVADTLLAGWYGPTVQLMVFQSCRTAVPSFTTIAGRMLQLGVPAVIAMQDLVAMRDARHFASAFYRSLLRDGLVDVAANRGRAAMREQTDAKNWSIPALFMRLKGGLLWSPDAVRDYVVQALRRVGASPGRSELPLKVVEDVAGIKYDPAAGASGPWFPMSVRASALLAEKNATVILIGPQGSGKTAETRRLFVELADRFLASTATADAPAAPVLGQLTDLSPWGNESAGLPPLFADFRQIVLGYPVPERLQGARFVFLLSRGTVLGRRARFEALGALGRLLRVFPGSSCLLTYGETELDELTHYFPDAHVLVVQPMNWLEIRAHLRTHEPTLLTRLSINRLNDLATSPWLLGQMRDQARLRGLDHALQSRADVLETCVSRMLATFDNTRIPLAAAETVLEAIAWRIQEKRPTERDAGAAVTLCQVEVDRIITDARGTGEFGMADMRKELVACGLIAQSGEGDVRFPNPSIRALLAARYLARSPRPERLVDDLAATFGRLGRLRYWTETLVIAAALPEFEKYRARLLASVLTGSSMLEGEQVFLAARLYQETDHGKGVIDPDFPQTVRQIVDSLVWRARDVEGRPYEDRRNAVEYLAAMQHPDAVPHLLPIAMDQIRWAGAVTDRVPQFEYAGIRFLAMDGLWQQVPATLREVAKRPDAAKLQEVITAWQTMYDDPAQSDPIVAILKADEPYRSPIAAFALLQFGPAVVEQKLLPLYWEALKDRDVLWCITEGLAWMDGDWLAEKVVDPLIDRLWTADAGGARDDLRTMLCYLIRELGDAPRQSRRRVFLERCLKAGDVTTRVWALRALAKLREDPGDAAMIPTPRAIAEAILAPDTGANRETLSVLEITPDWLWKQGALEALRDAGDTASVELIRGVRAQLDDPGLFRLSFQVAEEIYWRCAGGMIQPTT